MCCASRWNRGHDTESQHLVLGQKAALEASLHGVRGEAATQQAQGRPAGGLVRPCAVHQGQSGFETLSLSTWCWGRRPHWKLPCTACGARRPSSRPRVAPARGPTARCLLRPCVRRLQWLSRLRSREWPSLVRLALEKRAPLEAGSGGRPAGHVGEAGLPAGSGAPCTWLGLAPALPAMILSWWQHY